MFTEDDNTMLGAPPILEKIKDVFSLSPDSARRPDGVSGKFYQHCWEIIAKDLYLMIYDFFAGNQLPKALAHTCFMILPKVENPRKFTELRPVNLSNFSCKIISKMLNTRLAKVIHKIISPNQAGFLNGRSISNNIMLT